jgi:hypothetical protein
MIVKNDRRCDLAEIVIASIMTEKRTLMYPPVVRNSDIILFCIGLVGVTGTKRKFMKANDMNLTLNL